MLADYDADAIAEVLGLTSTDPQVEASRASAAAAPDGAALGEADAVPLPGGQALHSAPSAVVIERLVTSGLLRASLRVVAERIAGNDDKAVSRIERAVASAGVDRWARMSVPESERTERIARLFVQARRALGTEVEARDFLTTPHSELDGRTPLEAASTDLGARRVERLLTALEYGLAL